MLKTLRKKGVAKKVLWVVAVIVIISFGFFGTAYLLTGNQRADYAGKIFGRKVSFDEFREAFQQVRIQAIMRFGDRFEEVAKFLNLEAETWDRLILLHEVKKRRIKIPDEEVIKTIREYPFFQRDGQFDTLLYNDILRYVFKTRAREFEEDIRKNLALTELIGQETSQVAVSGEEIFNAFERQNEKVQISYIFVPSDQFKDKASFTEEDLKEYYARNKIEFLTPPTINIDYIRLDFPEEEIKDQQPLTSEKTLPREETEEAKKAKQAVRDQAETIFEELLVDPDMTKITSEYNLAVQSSGYFSKEQPNLAPGWSYDFLDRLFEFENGRINEPLETKKGILIAKISDKKDASIPDYEKAKEKVTKAVISQKSKEMAGEKAREYLTVIREKSSAAEAGDFSKIAAELSLEVQQTPLFTRGQYLPQIGISQEFQDASFRLNDDHKISEAVGISNGYCILHFDTYVPADKEEYEKQKETLRASLLEKRQTEVFSAFLNQLRLKAGLTNNLPENNN